MKSDKKTQLRYIVAEVKKKTSTDNFYQLKKYGALVIGRLDYPLAAIGEMIHCFESMQEETKSTFEKG